MYYITHLQNCYHYCRISAEEHVIEMYILGSTDEIMIYSTGHFNAEFLLK